MREIRVQEPTPSKMGYRPDGIRLRWAVGSDVRVHVIIRQQTVGIHTLAEILHSKLQVHDQGDLPLRTHGRECKPFLKLVKGRFPILAFFLIGA